MEMCRTCSPTTERKQSREHKTHAAASGRIPCGSIVKVNASLRGRDDGTPNALKLETFESSEYSLAAHHLLAF